MNSLATLSLVLLGLPVPLGLVLPLGLPVPLSLLLPLSLLPPLGLHLPEAKGSVSNSLTLGTTQLRLAAVSQRQLRPVAPKAHAHGGS